MTKTLFASRRLSLLGLDTVTLELCKAERRREKTGRGKRKKRKRRVVLPLDPRIPPCTQRGTPTSSSISILVLGQTALGTQDEQGTWSHLKQMTEI